MKRTALTALVIVPSLLLAACGDGDGAAADTTGQPAAEQPAGGAEGPGTDDGRTIAAEHNNADTAFARSMIQHHQQGLEIARVMLAKEDLPDGVTEMAQRISAEQGPALVNYQRMLEAWGEPDVPTSDEAVGDVDPTEPPADGPEPSESTEPATEEFGRANLAMSGQLTPSQMNELEAVDGEEAAKLFLDAMIKRDQGVIDMANTEAEQGQNPDAKARAKDLVEEQKAEIEELQQLLDQMG